jgi:alpha-L-fucosidase
MKTVPLYLEGYETEWQNNPHAANLKWFERANFGMFIHYGLYSALGAGEWVQFHKQIPVAEYARLKDDFHADKFDADFITDLALDAGMKYVTLVTCHHDSFCLWDSQVEAFNSVNSPCGRDLVREVAAQCAQKGLGFFTYYTFMLNWKHPYFLSREQLSIARPDYTEAQPEYLFRSLDDYPKYVEYMLACMTELLELEYPLAGMWLDIIIAYYLAPELVPVKKTYELVRRMRPEALIAYKQGATGTEDFASPEFSFASLGERLRKQGNTEAANRAERAWEINRIKHNEICMTLQKGGWGYNKASAHLSADELLGGLGHARANNCNLLANVGPLPDGSIHPDDIKALREAGKRIRSEGWPLADVSVTPMAHNYPTDAGAV